MRGALGRLGPFCRMLRVSTVTNRTSGYASLTQPTFLFEHRHELYSACLVAQHTLRGNIHAAFQAASLRPKWLICWNLIPVFSIQKEGLDWLGRKPQQRPRTIDTEDCGLRYGFRNSAFENRRWKFGGFGLTTFDSRSSKLQATTLGSRLRGNDVRSGYWVPFCKFFPFDFVAISRRDSKAWRARLRRTA